MQKNERYLIKKRATKIAGTEKVTGFFYVHKDAKRPICGLSIQFNMKSNTYIPQRYKSAANGLKSAYLHCITKTGCKWSTLYKTVLQCNKVPGCKFAIQPKNCIGLRPPERLRVQYDRTVTSEGLEQPNGLGFQATERLTSINKDLTEKICTERN